MGLAIHNLIESVCNPSGRFKMLDGIRVKTDSKGDPVFLYKDRSVCFWESEKYLPEKYRSGTGRRTHPKNRHGIS